MSIKVMSAVWEMKLPDSEKLILLALADWADDQGRCWPSVAQLSAKSSKSERTVQAALKSLESKGALARDMKPGKGTVYTINPRSGFTPAETAPPQRLRRTPAAAAPNTSIHTNREANASLTPLPPKRADRFVLPDWVPADAWAGYEDMRRKARKPMTDRARRLAIAKLGELAAAGDDPGAVLDQSTMNNWQGLFCLKDKSDGRHMAGNHRAGAGGYRYDPAFEGLKRLAAEFEQRPEDFESC